MDVGVCQADEPSFWDTPGLIPLARAPTRQSLVTPTSRSPHPPPVPVPRKRVLDTLGEKRTEPRVGPRVPVPRLEPEPLVIENER